MATKHFIKGAIKKPGAATAAAKREGLTVAQWAQKHKHDSGKAGYRARFAIVLSQLRKK